MCFRYILVLFLLILPSISVEAFRAEKSNYPRPVMERPDWQSLNGSWGFNVSYNRDQTNTGGFPDRIEVPFPQETSLAGFKKSLITEKHRLWYRRTFNVPSNWLEKRVLLHFDAIDWESTVWLNGKKLGTHQGGFDLFSFDITDALKPTGDQEIVVSIYDPTDSGYQPRGKQALHSDKLFYSASSGIWQTVWLEPVPHSYIKSLKTVPDIDAGALKLKVFTTGETNGLSIEAAAFDGEKGIAQASGKPGEEIYLKIPDAKLWSPDNPFLYILKVKFLKHGEVLDSVSSYFGMRKISVVKDEKGVPRLMLNNKQLFQLGPLDQGYWQEGRYTAPSDEALRYDIEVMKKLGFNMCRKHVKVEPERWYYWCDKLGLLVWQDMPNGDRIVPQSEREMKRHPESARLFEQDLKRMIVGRGNHPSIVVWTAFNQGWGQYDTARITDMIKELDPSRLVISASGWHDFGTGDIRSIHTYQHPDIPLPSDGRVSVLGECGGLGLVVPGHMWKGKGYWNVRYFNSAEELLTGYEQMMSRIQTLAEEKELSAAVITQLSDIETELNGFMTYDRKVIKMPVDKVREINERVIRAGSGIQRN